MKVTPILVFLAFLASTCLSETSDIADPVSHDGASPGDAGDAG